MSTAALTVALALALPLSHVVAIAGRLAAASIDLMRMSSKMGNMWHGHAEHSPAVGIDNLLCLLDGVPFCPCAGQSCGLAWVDELLAGYLMGRWCISIRRCFFS